MFDNSKVSEFNIMKPNPRKEGCLFTGFVKQKDEKGNVFVQFTFQEAATKAELKVREFQPKKLPSMTDEDYKSNIDLQVSRVAHIVRAFVSEAEYLSIKITERDPNSMVQADIEANWAEYMRKSAAVLGVTNGVPTRAAGQLCALKVVYNKNYSALPKVPPFISTVNHPKEFVNNPKYDFYEMIAITPDKEGPKQPSIQDAEFGVPAPTTNGATITATQAPAQHESGF